MNLPGRARRASVSAPIDPNAPLADISLHPAPPKRPVPGKTEGTSTGVDPKTLQGIVIDDTQAKTTGNWVHGSGNPGFVGAGYIYDGGKNKGEMSVRYEFSVPTAGKYEVRISYNAHENRSDAVPVTVHSVEGDKTITVNQQKKPELEGGFISLGTFTFDPAKPGAVTVSNKGTKGNVSADAVQVLPTK
jgi:hypothetical protein